MGRRAEPAQVHVLKGTYRKDRHQHGAKVEPQAPKCPTWLPKAAKKHWKEIAPELEKAGLITLLDKAAFAAYCDTAGKFEEVTKRLADLDQVLDETPSGYAVQSALFTVRNKLWDQIMKAAPEFGLTPGGRSKVKDAGQQQLPFGGAGDWDEV